MSALSVLEDSYEDILSGLSAPDENDLQQVILYRTEVAKRLISEDIRRGLLPEDISGFAVTHQYVDGNLYLVDEEHPNARVASFFSREDLSVEEAINCFNQVIGSLDNWLSEKCSR